MTEEETEKGREQQGREEYQSKKKKQNQCAWSPVTMWHFVEISGHSPTAIATYPFVAGNKVGVDVFRGLIIVDTRKHNAVVEQKSSMSHAKRITCVRGKKKKKKRKKGKRELDCRDGVFFPIFYFVWLVFSTPPCFRHCGPKQSKER